MKKSVIAMLAFLALLAATSYPAAAQEGLFPKVKFCDNPYISGWQLPDPDKVHPGEALQAYMCRAGHHMDWLIERVDNPAHAKRSIYKLSRIRTLLKALYNIKPNTIQKMPKEAHMPAMLGFQACMDDVLDWLQRCERSVRQNNFEKARFYIDHIRTKEHQCHLGYAFPKY